jgi:purine catabolism regulator
MGCHEADQVFTGNNQDSNKLLLLQQADGLTLEERLIKTIVSLGAALDSDLAFFFHLDQAKNKVGAYYSQHQQDEPQWHKMQWQVTGEVAALFTQQTDNWEKDIHRLLLGVISKKRVASLLFRRVNLAQNLPGLMGIASFEPKIFNPNKGAMLDLIANGIGDLWENHDLKISSQQMGREMDALIKFSKYLSSNTGEMELVLEQVLNELKNIIEVESCGVLLYDQDKQELVLQKPAFGYGDDKFTAYSLSTETKQQQGIGVAIKVFLTGEAYVCNSIDRDQVTNRRLAEAYGVRNSLTVPLIVDNRRVGVLHAINKKTSYFTDSDVRLLELLGYQMAKVIENVRLFGQIEAKNDLLRHSMDIHSQLTRMVLKEKNLEEIIFRLGQLIGRDVIVQDQFFKVLGYSFAAEQDQLPVVEKAMAEDLWQKADFRKLINLVNNSKQPVLLPCYPDYGLTRMRLIAPITVGNSILGYVSILEDGQGKLGEQHYLAIEHAVTVFTLKMMQQKIAYDVEERIKGEFLEDLLNGNYRSVKDIIQRAAYFGYDMREPFQVMVVDIDNFSEYVKKQQGNEYQLANLKRKVFEVVTNCLNERLPAAMVGSRSDTFVVVAPYSPKKAISKPEAVADYIRSRVKYLLEDVTVSIGIGKISSGIEEIESSYQEARRAVTIGKKFGKKDEVIRYDSLGAYKILFAVEGNEELDKFSSQTLGALLDYDQDKNANLIQTLNGYLTNNCNNQKTADSLFIHLNTLKYRLQKIQDITGRDLNDPEERLNLQLALKVLEIKKL